MLVSGIEVKRAGISLLISRGWFDAEVADDPEEVRAALVAIVNDVLTEPESEIKFSPRPLRRAFQAVKTISFGLF